MESELSPDNQKNLPPVPIKTYQWEDLRKAREAGGYPWTHLLKAPLEGEITAEDIIRETTPRRSMSREFSKSRTHSPVDRDVQKILNLDSSPGSSRKHSQEGKDEGVHVPNFSKEISLDSEDDIVNKISEKPQDKKPDNQRNTHLMTPMEKPLSISPKSILKRRIPEQQYIGITETREKTKCCHPLVNKIKHLADKTLHKLDKNENEKSPGAKRKKNEESQEIRQLKNSPGAVRRQKFSAIKLGDSDEMSKTMCIDTPPPRKKKEHIYEDIEESREANTEKSLQLSPEVTKTNDTQAERQNNDNNENDSIVEKKSNASQDPSLFTEDNASLKADEYIMEKLHKIDDINKEAILLDEEMDSEEPNVEEVYQNQKDDTRKNNDSPNITITEILDDDNTIEQSTTIPIESSPSPSPRDIDNRKDAESIDNYWSRPNSDHDYEIIDKPPPNIIYTAPTVDEKPVMVKTDDELSSTTSLERKYLQHTSDEEEQIDDKENKNSDKTEELINAETLQKDIEERFFVNTPSTVSRTECEVSTSQVDSSALENLPLKRSSRNKNGEGGEHKIQQRIKEGTGKIKTQAGKLKTKLHNLRNKQFSLPDRPKFKMPDRPKISLPDRPKFTLPDKRKFSLPERPKFKKINISEKLSFGDRKKFSFPERPKFSVPDMPKFKMPERPKINFPSLGRKKEYKVDSNKSESTSDLQNVASVEFEAKTYPRLFNRRKKSQIQKTSSSPTLNREDTPPPTFTFTRVKKLNQDESCSYIPDDPEEPREYGTVDNETNYDSSLEGRQQFSTTYDFDKLDQVYMDEEENQQNLNENRNANSVSDISPSKQEYTHINELNNDEFFVRPRGISRENIQVREYLSDEIRQAFNIPKNVLAVMGSNTGMNGDNIYANEPDEDPELMNDSKEPMSYSTEDINDRDDGYYTFPPVRPSRAKRKKRETESIKFIDDSVNASMQFSEVDLGISEDQFNEKPTNGMIDHINPDLNKSINDLEIRPPTDLRSIHEYANDDVIEYPEGIPIQSQTLPMPPKRKRKSIKKDIKHSSLNDFTPPEMWQIPKEQAEDIIVYRTEHEYIVPQAETKVTEHSPLPPRRTRSRSSRATSLCDDDRTSHGAESLILDTHVPATDDVEIESDLRQESPGYATVDKGNVPSKTARRSKSKTPPARRRKSHSAERKYYTVSGKKSEMPSRPPRKKSSTSLMTLNSYTKDSMNEDLTQYDEIDEPRFEEVHKDLQSGEVVSKMKDRPLPPPPRPPRGPKRKKTSDEIEEQTRKSDRHSVSSPDSLHDKSENQAVIEIEVSTQTDPLPDDIDFELGMDENLDISMSSSLKDIIDEESILGKAHDKVSEPHRASRPVSRSEKSLKLSDPKISDFSKANLERTSPTVILVEKRVSSPTRINERDEILTEASLTVQPIDIEESLIPNVPPLPKIRSCQTESSKNVPVPETNHALEKVTDACRDIQLDNLVTQRLQVSDLDVGRLNVSELQATKILVSDIEGMTLNVNEMDSKSGHISVSGIEFSQSVIDEIVKKFAEISTTIIPPVTSQIQATQETTDTIRPVSREEETQTENVLLEKTMETATIAEDQLPSPPSVSLHPETTEEISIPPQRPPPPDLTPLLYSYLQDIATPTASSLHPRPYSYRERHLSEFHDPQHQTPPPPARRTKRKPAILHSESSSDEDKPRPSPRRIPPPVRIHEPTITEAGAQFFRVCQTSISRTFRNIFNMFMTYINRTEDKRDVQMAMVIFLVLIAGLIMFGLSDSRTIHHHHWEFFNPPDGKQ